MVTVTSFLPSRAVDEEGKELNWTHFFTKVVGVMMSNHDGSSRQQIIKKCRVKEELYLIREPSNEHDQNAIAVYREDRSQIGYLNADTAELLTSLINDGHRFRAHVSALTGGSREKPYRGVNVEINLI